MKYSKTKTKPKKEAETGSGAPPQIILLNSAKEEGPKLRMVGLFGDLVEEKVSDLVQGLMALKEYDVEEVYEDPENPDSPVTGMLCKPIDFHISTWGGCARGMFAVYDAMRHVREHCDVVTYGLGKVMSAGVLLLAAGSKGKRKIGKNCRVMIHSVRADQWGAIHNLENEFEETKWLQEQHINALIEETDMTKRHLKKLLDRKVNVYLTAKEAVEYGIADIIV